MRFQFTKTDSAASLSEESIIYADASALYPCSTEASTFSYGFVTQEIVRENADLQIPELNSGFEAFEWFAGADSFQLTQNDFGVGSQYDGQGQLPLIFSAKVPAPGNYELCIRFYAMNDTDNVVIFAGRRRLVWIGNVSAGQFYTIRCIENVSPVIPRFHSEKMEDTSVRIALLGKGIFLNSLSCHVWEGPTVYIAGDSTVTDQTGCYPYFPEHCYSGWGQMLSAYLKCDMAVSNHAHSGLTTESFRSEGHYDIMRSLIKAGDYVFFQFAHNDQKLPELTADGGYRNNLLRYISEIKEIGAHPVLVTPLARNTWFGNREEYNDLLFLYAEECKKIASEEQIPLIDLHGRVKKLVLELGRNDVKKYFYPSDYTHSNDYGAYLFAGYVYEGFTGKNAYDTNPHWNAPEEFHTFQKPPAYVPANAGKEDTAIERPEEKILRWEALDLVIKRFNFFPSNVYNDLFEDMVGHETYAGVIQSAHQNGILPEYILQQKCFHPLGTISGKEFWDYTCNAFHSRFGKAPSISDADLEVLQKADQLTRGECALLLGTI